MSRNRLFLVFIVSVTVVFTASPFLFAESRSAIDVSDLVPVDHWSVKAMDYLVETGICDGWIRPSDDEWPVETSRHRSYMAKMTIHALKGVQNRLENDVEIPGAVWLMLEGLAAQYADGISEQGVTAKNVIVISRFMLPKTEWSKPEYADLPDEHWLLIGFITITLSPGYPEWNGHRRSFGRYEVAMLVLRSIKKEKEVAEQGIVVDAGKLVMYESMVKEVAPQMYELGESASGWLDWLRSQPEYPSYLLDDRKGG